MRTIIIGDLHGCIESLERLLAKLDLDTTERLIFLGDLFDRGPSSWEVFQKIRQLSDEYGERFVLLRGNHDDYLIQEESLSEEMQWVWRQVGRQATVNSFEEHGESMEDAAPWLEAHCIVWYEENRFQCTHAGIRTEPIGENDFRTLVHDRKSVKENRYRGKLTITGHIALEMPVWFQGNGQYEVLEYGKSYPLPEYGVICIDTGCGKGGLLSAMVIEDDKFQMIYE